jgi:NitT/TauT family transport system substrate-binding protein
LRDERYKMKKATLMAIALTAVVAAAGGFGAGWVMKPTPSSVDQLTYQMSWTYQGYQAPMWVALDQGFWLEQNIAVRLIIGYGSSQVLAAISSGNIQFTDWDSSVGIMARQAGTTNVGIYMARDKPVFGVHWVEEHQAAKGRNITTPRDLVGLTVGVQRGMSDATAFPGWLTTNGVNPNNVNMIYADSAVLVSMLLTGQVDAILRYATTIPQAVVDGKAVGLTVKSMYYADWGFNAYGQVVGTTDQMIQQKPDLVRRFVRGLYKGFYFATKYPDKAMNILRKYASTINATTESMALSIDNIMRTPSGIAQNNGYGYMQQDRWQWTLNFQAAAGNWTTNIPKVSDLYTNAFIPVDFKALEAEVDAAAAKL